ncbi:protein of unknown function (plasmid) [Thermococcus nautili]|uniref:hypothetical protein n=1 Tax=Thermococcus nautili TaxID=195522 RepID=UPI002555C91E|nr:hypothetical protein [Thermococcus nautili]CAI1494235.1 protein of unknown function [Thermococcus nautili]
MEIGLKIVRIPMAGLDRPLKTVGVIPTPGDLGLADYTLGEDEELILPEEYIERCPLGRDRVGIVKVNIKFANVRGVLKTEKISKVGSVCKNCPLADLECFQRGYITEEELKKTLMG